MSGAAGGTRIPRSAVEQTVKDYTDKILSKIEGFKDAKLSGSFNRPEKEDFGDIDIIVTIETDNTKKEVKKMIGDLFQSLPDNELPPLQNPRYKGKKFINHGEMVSNLYPISGMPGEFVQVDNIISLSQEEGEFKKTILDYPAELQGLILGLVKTPLLEEDPAAVFSRLGIKDIPKAGEDQEYEFHIDTSDLTLRLVTYGENYRILNSNTVWQSKNFNDVQTLLKGYDLKGNFEDIIAKVKTLKNERSKNRVKGFFKKSIKVGAAEKGTPKGDTKQNALDVVAQLEEGFRSNIKNGLRAQQLEEADRDRIAIFPGAFKPPHKDHVSRIIAASKKVGDEGSVTVLVAPSTRAKEGQEAISAEQSLRVFNILKDKNVIPNNVNIIVSPEKSPVLAAYKEFEANITQPYIAVFGKDDKARFKNIDDKLPNVTVDSFESAGIGNTSATDLRIALLQRDKEEIAKYIPNGITVGEYLDALGLSETLQETAEEAANLWEPHAAMLARMRKQPQLLKGLWKSLSKPSRKALVLYFRKQNTQTENVIPVENEKASPYGSGYTLVDEGLWANINAKKKRGEKASHGNSKAFKAAKKAGDALEKTKGLKEGGGEKKLRVFDFDDTLVHVDATIHVTHKDGTKLGLTPAQYAVYVPKEGDTFNFSEFSSVIKKAKPLESNIKDLIRSYNDPTEKTTILTARLLGYPVKKYLKDEFNIEPYVVGLGSSDPKDKSRWIEAQIKKGYNNIEFRDDSQKNVDAVSSLKDEYPEVELTSTLVTEGIDFKALEKVLDEMFDDLDIDINFTKHFKERVIERGLTEEDIIELMRKIHQQHGEEVSDLATDENRVFTHLRRLVDVAAVNAGYGDDYLKDLVLKTAYKRNDKSEPEFRTNASAPKLTVTENASYNKNNKVQYKIAELTDHMKAKGMKIEPLPTVEFINGDSENAKDFFGKTAYYDPASSTIVLYTEGRHPKDIVRSFAHEMIHHMQNLEGRLENITTTNTHEDDNLNDLEKEANLKGTMTFRNWTDSLNENIFQKSLDQTEKEALEIAYKDWDTFGGKECNNGFCDIFAKNLAKHLPGSKILSTEDPRNETLGHVWVEYEGKYFDAETPDGVSSWKDLPWMKEFYSKVGSYPTDIETLNESVATPELQKEKINIAFELFDGTKISEDITLAISLNSQGLFELGDNIEKYSGLTLKDAQEFNETPDDAYIYGLVNTMNDGQDIFFWTNGTRLVGNAKRIGTQTAIIEQLAHEGLHLTRAILAKSVMGDGFPTEEWPSIGEQDNDKIGEEQLATALSHVLEKISAPFVKMASKYIPELDTAPTQPNTADSLDELAKPTIKKDPFGLNAYAVELARELEEDLIADRIECSNCGWSWKKETGGKSPYLCHKCGHDNTPKLNEGAYDTITAQVSSDIFKAWKEQFDKDSTVKKATLSKSYDVENKNGRSIVFDLEADLNFIETEESTYSPNGDADSGDAETYDEEGNVEDTGMDGNIHLYFQVDPRTLPKLWSTISMDLKDIVRHEIEHLTQSGYNVVPSKELPDDQDLRFYIQQLGTMPASNYYLLDKEVPAMLQGLYYKAKKMKKPFKEVAEAYLDIFVDNGTIDAEAKVDVLNRWRPEAKKLNLPSL